MDNISIHNQDCHVFLQNLDDESVQLFLVDPPYAITKHDWDSPLRWDELWPIMWKKLRKNGCIAIHSSIPFTIDIINSQRLHFTYWWTGHKTRKTGFLNANRMPLRNTEEICIFYKQQTKYHPQMTNIDRITVKDNGKVPSNSVGHYNHVSKKYTGYFPTTLQSFFRIDNHNETIATQKNI